MKPIHIHNQVTRTGKALRESINKHKQISKKPIKSFSSSGFFLVSSEDFLMLSKITPERDRRCEMEYNQKVKDGKISPTPENYAEFRETFYDMELTDIPSNFSSSHSDNIHETKNPMKRKASDPDDLETPSSKRVNLESKPESKTPLTADVLKEHNIRTEPQDKKQSTVDYVLEKKECEMPGIDDDMD